jgi:hypothetical protein
MISNEKGRLSLALENARHRRKALGGSKPVQPM